MVKSKYSQEYERERQRRKEAERIVKELSDELRRIKGESMKQEQNMHQMQSEYRKL